MVTDQAERPAKMPAGIYELTEDVSASPYYNHDLAPTRWQDRKWGLKDLAALWVALAACVPTYMLASSLIGEGMSWWQAVLTIVLANVIVLLPMVLNAHAGTKYGIPFPVYCRASFGVRGANLPALLRALVACGWFGIQAWIGGQAVNTFLRVVFPPWPGLLGSFGGHATTEWISFLMFWGLNILIIYRGMNVLRAVENWAAPFVLVMTAALVWWAISRANGIGPILSLPGKLHGGAFWSAFWPGLTAMVGYWATLSLNMPDFTRFGHSQREQAFGQIVALPTTMTVFAAMGVMITSAAILIYPNMNPNDLWDPMKLVGQFSQVWVIAISMF